MKRILILLLLIFSTGFTYITQQTDYNCIPASIETIYKMYGVNNITQHDIRNELDTKQGVVPIDDMERYLDKYFIYDTKRICCEDSFINSFGKYPIIVVYNAEIIEPWKNYKGHCVVATEIMDNNVKILDPDVGYERYVNKDKFIKAIKDWNSEIYIIKDIKKTSIRE